MQFPAVPLHRPKKRTENVFLRFYIGIIPLLFLSWLLFGFLHDIITSWLSIWIAGYNSNILNQVFLVCLFLPFFPFSFSFFRAGTSASITGLGCYPQELKKKKVKLKLVGVFLFIGKILLAKFTFFHHTAVCGSSRRSPSNQVSQFAQGVRWGKLDKRLSPQGAFQFLPIVILDSKLQ
jgi:hypothetical protein